MVKVFNLFNIPIKLHWSFPLIFAVFIKSSISLALVVTFCILLHELGHALLAKKYGQKVNEIILMGFGGVTTIEGFMPKPREQIIIMAGGPMVNTVLAMVALPLMLVPVVGSVARIFVAINLMLGVGNLIPVYPLDGGRILNALLQYKFEPLKAMKLAAIVGTVIAGVLSVVFIVLKLPFLLFLFVAAVVLGWLDYRRHKRLFTLDIEQLLS